MFKIISTFANKYADDHSVCEKTYLKMSMYSEHGKYYINAHLISLFDRGRSSLRGVTTLLISLKSLL